MYKATARAQWVTHYVYQSAQILLESVYSTVTDLARFLGWSTLHPLSTAMW